MSIILFLLFLFAVGLPARWFAEQLPPDFVGTICGLGVALGWIGLLASRANDARVPERLTTLRHLAAALVLAAAPMSCSALNYLSQDPARDLLGFQKETPRGHVDSEPYRFRTKSQRRAKMMRELPGQIADRLAFAVSPHGATLLGASALGALPFFLLFRRERQRSEPAEWLNGTFWLLTTIATIFFLVVFANS